MFRAVAILIVLILFQTLGTNLLAQSDSSTTQQTATDSSAAKKREILRSSHVTYSQKDIKLTIQNVDISHYPIIKVIVEAYNIYGQPLDTLYAEGLSVLENGVEHKVISVDKLSMDDHVPVDFVFVIDQTGSMQTYIDAVRKKVRDLTSYLKKGGIDYTLSLILFSDEVDKVYQPTADVNEFLGWISRVKAQGGGDVKENTLEALRAAADEIHYRPAANKVAVLITNSPYHEKGEHGNGTTNFTTETITQKLFNDGVRVFSIIPPRLTSYKYIASNTRGNFYDIDYPFSTILDNFSNQLTNLYALKYRTFKPAIPDSINVAIINEKKETLTKKTIPIVELGRKLIIENMLYKTGSSELPDSVPELEVLTEFMQNRKNVVINVEGHTDAVGSEAVNDRLSKMRAEGVKNYLVRKGISPRRIKTTGYGERRPIASNDTEFGRKLNRRTEIVIISK
jgi:outer membrane protein OmpA-like peptidoglycan-associated protein/Mg-chelatase subunit ChlD